MEISEDKLGVLQNLEFSVATVWRTHREMSDYTALRAYEAAFQTYRAELRGHVPKPSGLTGLDLTTFESVKAVCEFRLGRGTQGDGPETAPPVSLELLIDCLRELARSTERHTKAGGKQGYLTFINQFLP
jgi:hypothetical protein